MCIVNRDMWGLIWNSIMFDKTDDILPAGSAFLLLYHRRYTRQGFPLLILVVFFVESHVYVLSLLFPRPGWIYFPPFPHFTCNLFLPSWLFLGLTILINCVQPSATRIQFLSILIRIQFLINSVQSSATRIQGAGLPWRAGQVPVHIWSSGGMSIKTRSTIKRMMGGSNCSLRTTTRQTTLVNKNQGMVTAPRENILSTCLMEDCRR